MVLQQSLVAVPPLQYACVFFDGAKGNQKEDPCAI